MTVNQYFNSVESLTSTILSGATISDAIDLYGYTLLGLIMPAAFTGTTIKIMASPTSGGTYQYVYPDGADYSLSVAASKNIPISNVAILAGWRYIKLVSGSAEGADRAITLSVRPVG